MSVFFQVCDALLGMYRERNFNPAFWAEPLNALTNASFLFAAGFALEFAGRRRATTLTTIALITLAGAIGFGSFCFHTVPNRFTISLDVGPIVLFQILFLWLVSRRMLSISVGGSAAIVIGVVGAAFALLPVRQPLNGSLFYIPPLVAILTLGTLWAKRSRTEPYLFVGAACCFTLAVAARSIDWIVPWPFGTHFLWHLLNGVVVYLAIRAWVVFVPLQQETAVLTTPLEELRARIDQEESTPDRTT